MSRRARHPLDPSAHDCSARSAARPSLCPAHHSSALHSGPAREEPVRSGARRHLARLGLGLAALGLAAQAALAGVAVRKSQCDQLCGGTVLICDRDQIACCCPTGSPPTWTCACMSADCNGNSRCNAGSRALPLPDPGA